MMEPRKKEGSACPPVIPAPKNQAMEPAAPALGGEKTPPAYGKRSIAIFIRHGRTGRPRQ